VVAAAQPAPPGSTGASGSPGAGGSILTQDVGTAETVTGRISGLRDQPEETLTVYFDLRPDSEGPAFASG
jgi:hypothetical protein